MDGSDQCQKKKPTTAWYYVLIPVCHKKSSHQHHSPLKNVSLSVSCDLSFSYRTLRSACFLS